MRKLWIFLPVVMTLVACTPASSLPRATPTQSIPSMTQPACQPSQTQPSRNDFPEVQGTMKSSDGEMWALLFFDEARAKEDEKIVWRITGTGKQFDVQAKHEDGTIIQPIWGPEYHGDSNWERPGNEWGTGFNFPKPGCWTLTVTRGTTSGEIRLDVLAQ